MGQRQDEFGDQKSEVVAGWKQEAGIQNQSQVGNGYWRSGDKAKSGVTAGQSLCGCPDNFLGQSLKLKRALGQGEGCRILSL